MSNEFHVDGYLHQVCVDSAVVANEAAAGSILKADQQRGCDCVLITHYDDGIYDGSVIDLSTLFYRNRYGWEEIRLTTFWENMERVSSAADAEYLRGMTKGVRSTLMMDLCYDAEFEPSSPSLSAALVKCIAKDQGLW